MKAKCYPLHLLNNYLRSPTDHERERHFTDYYMYLSTPLMRYIRYRLFKYRLEMETEDCWQDTFERHSRLVSTRRIESAERLQELIRCLQPPMHDDLLRQKVSVWTADVKQKIKNLMEFVGRATTAEDDEELARLAPGMNSDWHACKERGYALLHQLLQHYALLDQLLLHHTIDAEDESAEDSAPGEIDDDAAMRDVEEDGDDYEIEEATGKAAEKVTEKATKKSCKQRVAVLRKIIEADGEAAADTVVGCAGGARFSITLMEILELMPGIQIPRMNALYTLANYRVSDRKRRAEKDPLHDSVELSLQNEDHADKSKVSSIDRILPVEPEQEEQDLWRDVRTLLYQPVLEAKAALQQAEAALQQPNLTDRQRRRAEKECQQTKEELQHREERFKLRWAVLNEYFREGHSQEGTAKKLETTRDKVRQLLKEIYALLKSLKDKETK